MTEGHDENLAGLFEDLEQQAAGLELTERDAELADRARGEYATVPLAARLHASSGHDVGLRLRCGLLVRGRVRLVGRDWLSLSSPREPGPETTHLVPFHAVTAARGLSGRAVPEELRPVQARLGLGSAVHRLAEDGPLHLRLADASEVTVRLRRVGADFLEGGVLAGWGAGDVVVLPFSAVTLLRGGADAG